MQRRTFTNLPFLVLATQMLSGCFVHHPVPAPGATPAPNVTIRFAVPMPVQTVSSPGVSEIVPDVRRVDAKLAWIEGDTVKLSQLRRVDAPGNWGYATYEQGAFLRTDSASYSSYRFSPKRTVVTVVGIGAAGAVLVYAASNMQWNMQMK